MRAAERGDLAADLQRGQKRFEAWREQQPKRGRRLPQSLWRLAIGLAKTYGIHRTKAALRLDYYSLKKQVEAATHSTATDSARSSGPAFIELPAPVTKQCLFELANGAGAVRRVQLVGYDTAEIETLARGFWKAE
jgi:hypothetical protein